MSKLKRRLGIDVLTATKQRIADVFDSFSRIYVSFSGGKDSTVLLHLVADEAIKRGAKIGVLFVDLEAQYTLTIQHVESCFSDYSDIIDRHWLALPLSLRNAVSVFEPKWMCWEPGRDWVRQPHVDSMTDHEHYPWFEVGMEFEELVQEFGYWYGDGQLTACLVGIRSDESLNRFRTLASRRKQRFRDQIWTTHVGKNVFNAYPIYDWRTEDVWTYHGKTGKRYNPLYDRMHQAGLSIHQQRICQPYGDDQRKGLWLYQIIEPETWGRVVARVNGANSGALYARESGNIMGVGKITLPPGHTWESFAKLLLDTMPDKLAEHYRCKISIFLQYWHQTGMASIPDEADPAMEAARKAPSWRRICKCLLRNDYWCKGLSFSQHVSTAYDAYIERIKDRRREWKTL